MDLEVQVKRHKEISRLIDELEKERKAIGVALLERMKGGKLLLVADFVIKKVQRFSFAVSIEEARKHNATKMEEAVDKEKLKSLFIEGSDIKGISQFQYVQVSYAKADTIQQPEE